MRRYGNIVVNTDAFILSVHVSPNANGGDFLPRWRSLDRAGRMSAGVVLKIVSIGEILWDIVGRAEFLGGAPLNFAAHSQRLGNQVALISALGDDERGRRALGALNALGLSTAFIAITSSAPTGMAAVSVDTSGNPAFAFNRPSAYDCVETDERQLAALAAFNPDWIYYGTLAQTSIESERRLERILERCPRAARFYDLNLRGGHWNPPLVERLCRAATVVKLNESEAELLFQGVRPSADFTLETFCHLWAETFDLECVCVTLGGRGCAIYVSGEFTVAAGYPVAVEDTVGAGDAFAAAFLQGMGLGWKPDRAASLANALGALVASRMGAIPEWTMNELRALTAATFHK